MKGGHRLLAKRPLTNGLMRAPRGRRITNQEFTWNSDGTLAELKCYQETHPLFALEFKWNPDGTLKSIRRLDGYDDAGCSKG